MDQLTDPRLVRLPQEALRALVAHDLDGASRACGLALTPYFVDHEWLWRIRLEQLENEPEALDWIARAAVAPDGTVLGHVGFHGPPDERGAVEVAYSVDPRHRRRGHGRRLLLTALDWAATEGVHYVLASISPSNTASLATIAGLGFVEIDRVIDPEDGPEIVYELDLRARSGPSTARAGQ